MQAVADAGLWIKPVLRGPFFNNFSKKSKKYSKNRKKFERSVGTKHSLHPTRFASSCKLLELKLFLPIHIDHNPAYIIAFQKCFFYVTKLVWEPHAYHWVNVKRCNTVPHHLKMWDQTFHAHWQWRNKWSGVSESDAQKAQRSWPDPSWTANTPSHQIRSGIYAILISLPPIKNFSLWGT